MARRLFLALMLFVLLWTGTLLHDIAESDDAPVAQSQALAKSKKLITGRVQNAELSTVGHVHDALLVSKPRIVDAPVATSGGGSVVPQAALSAARPDLYPSVSPRGPPTATPKRGPKIYLAHRVLLI